MSGLFETLEKIKARPGMYIGHPSVSDLFMFLVGYEYARNESGIDLTEQEERFYEAFQPWLQKRLGVTTTASWAKLILQSCSSEETAFYSFFDLLDEFLQAESFSAVGQPHEPVRRMAG